MNQFTRSGFHLAHLVRFILALTVVIAATGIGKGQVPARPDTPAPTNLSLEEAASSKPQTPSQQPSPPVNRLTRDEAVRLALAQASSFQTARYLELIASEDVRQ